jgi:hypothetical protein
MMLEVFRQVYRRHAAPTELALDPVTIAQTGLQAIDQIQEWAPGVGLSQSRTDSRRSEMDVCQGM